MSIHAVRSCRGYSLIELIITMVIVALLAGIAVPSWKSALQATRRQDATSLLQRLAVRQEQFRLSNNRYADANELGDALPAGLGMQNASEHYRLSVTIQNATYVATATARPDSPQDDDRRCRTFQIDAAGRRWSESADDITTTTECWQK